MSKKNWTKASLKRLDRLQGFRRSLYVAVIEDFGGYAGLALKLGIGIPRVSQYFTLKEELKGSTVENILKAFDSQPRREQLANEFAKEHTPELIQDEAGKDVQKFQLHLEKMIQTGFVLDALMLAEKTATETTDALMRQNMLERIVQLNLRLSNPAAALKALNEMKVSARSRQDLLDQQTASWTKMIVLNNLHSTPAKLIRAAYEEASADAEKFRPALSKERELWNHRRASVERDMALLLLHAVESRNANLDTLRFALDAVNSSIAKSDSVPIICTGLEVKARIETAIGRLTDAEQTLAELRSNGIENGSELNEKAELSRAILLSKRGASDEALDLLETMSERCYANKDLHHYLAANQLAANIMLGIPIYRETN